MSLVVENLNIVYSNLLKTKKNNIINNLSFEIVPGDIFALVGQNGAGKTSIIKCILKFMRAAGGSIKFKEMDISSVINDNKVGYCPEVLVFPPMISGKNYLLDIGILKGISKENLYQKIDMLVQLFDMKESINSLTSTYSKGMKRKLAFMQSVINDPELLILDEPTDGLDPISRRILLNYIKELSCNGTTILITSHLLSDLETVCNKIAFINKGKIAQIINPSEYLREKQIINVDMTIEKENSKERIIESFRNDKFYYNNIKAIEINNIAVSNHSLEDWYSLMYQEKEIIDD